MHSEANMKKIYYDGESKILKRIAELINRKPEIGEGHEDAYYGDYGKLAYLHSQLRSGNPHNVTAADVGLNNVNNRISLLESEYIALEARVEALERGQGGGDDSPFIIKVKNGVLQYNTLYLNDVWAVYSQDYTTQQRVEHLDNGSFLSGSGTIWKMSGGAIQPSAVPWYRAMTFTQPITLTNETTIKIRYSYNTASTYRTSHFSFWENADPSTILVTSMGTGDIVTATDYTYLINNTMPTTQTETTFSHDVTALQGKTVWLHLFSSDVIPLITGIWFE